jgi:hypothetical protein
MIYIMLWPETWLEKIKFRLQGIAPVVQCDEVRFSPGLLECITAEDKCIGVPFDEVLRIIWPEGYKVASDKAKAEYYQAMRENLISSSEGYPPPTTEEPGEPARDLPIIKGYG